MRTYAAVIARPLRRAPALAPEMAPPATLHGRAFRDRVAGRGRVVATHEARNGEDAGLVFAVAAGDRDALARLYDRHAGVLLAIGLRVLRSRREAEDLVHDVFLEVWRRAHEYEPSRASVRTWLVMMMRSRSLDRRRSHAVSRTTSLASDAREAPASEGPAEMLDRARVAAALDALPDAQREVLVLGYYEGLSSSEIAERLGAPIGTVKSRVAAALRALRARLGGPTEEPPPDERGRA